MKRLFSILAVTFSFCCTALAQKEIIVSETEPYMEWLGGKPDVNSYDMRLYVGFNEDANTLTVSLSSMNAELFGFKHNIIYGNVFHGNRKLGFEKLPYKVELDPSTSLQLSKGLKRQIKPNAKMHNFQPWLEYDGMDAQKSSETFPSDSLVQTFRLEPSAQRVTIRLKDCFATERKGSSGKQWNKFSINYYKNLDAEYVIFIQRDPCRKSAAQIDSVVAMHRILSIAHDQLCASFPEGTAKSLQELETFQELRNDLLKSFSKMSANTSCSKLARAINEYNACVDSVLNMTCIIPEEYKSEIVTMIGTNVERIDADGLLYCSRMIDELVAEWLMEENRTAKLSIIQQCNKIIDNGTAMAIGRRVVTDADRKALEVFAQAKEHFRRTCK